MKTTFLLWLTIFCFDSLQAQDKIDLKQSEQYMNTNTEIIVEATIFQIKQLDRIAYINLGGVYPQQKLNLIIFESEFEVFKDLLLTENQGRQIKVQGYITDYKENSRPQILLKDLSQVEFVE